VDNAVVQDSAVEQSSLERHFSARAQTPPRHSWNCGHWLFLVHLGTHISLTQTWFSKQSLREKHGAEKNEKTFLQSINNLDLKKSIIVLREQTPKAQMRLAWQSF
jgi:hypothetical protein